MKRIRDTSLTEAKWASERYPFEDPFERATPWFENRARKISVERLVRDEREMSEVEYYTHLLRESWAKDFQICINDISSQIHESVACTALLRILPELKKRQFRTNS